MIYGERLKSSESLRRFVVALLDRIDRQGALPKTFSLKTSECPDSDSIKLFFGADCVSSEKGAVIQLNVAKYVAKLPGAISELYQLLNRCRRNIPAEKAGKKQQLAGMVGVYLQSEPDMAVKNWLQSEAASIEKGGGELWHVFDEKGAEGVQTLLACLSKGFKVLRQSDSPLRLSHFGLAVTGDTKSCRVGTPLLKKFAEILCSFDPEIINELSLQEFTGPSARQRAALDMTRLVLDGAATQILAFGQIVFSKAGHSYTYVADHSSHGEPVILSWAQLENAILEQVPPTVVTVENETSFYDLIAGCDAEKVAVLCTMGQGNRLLVRLLRDAARMAGSFCHSGDLDRSGILILDSLRRRTGLDIKPLQMNAAILQQFAHSALPLPPVERQMIETLLARRPDIICRDLLQEILKQNSWLEQEVFTSLLFPDSFCSGDRFLQCPSAAGPGQ